MSLFEDDFERWNAMMPNGYSEGVISGNLSEMTTIEYGFSPARLKKRTQAGCFTAWME